MTLEACLFSQHSEKINGLRATQAPTHQRDLMGKGIQKTCCPEVVDHDNLIARTMQEPRGDPRGMHHPSRSVKYLLCPGARDS